MGWWGVRPRALAEGKQEGRMGWILDGSGILKVLDNGNLGSAPDIRSRSSKKANAIFEDGKHEPGTVFLVSDCSSPWELKLLFFSDVFNCNRLH